MKTVLNIKIEKKLKNNARETAARLGLPLSTVVNNYLRRFVDEREITFREPLIPTKKLQKILRAADKDIKAGRNLVGPFNSAAEMIKSLNSKI